MSHLILALSIIVSVYGDPESPHMASFDEVVPERALLVEGEPIKVHCAMAAERDVRLPRSQLELDLTAPPSRCCVPCVLVMDSLA